MTTTQAALISTETPAFATLDMISESGRNFILRPFSFQYSNTKVRISQMAQAAIGMIKRKHDNPLYNYCRPFDNCFENGNADQVVASIIRRALNDYKIATQLSSEGGPTWIVSWCLEASNNLAIKTGSGELLTVPPQLIVEAFAKSAMKEVEPYLTALDEFEGIENYTHAFEAYKAHWQGAIHE